MAPEGPKKAAFIVNPKAAHGTAMKIWEQIKSIVPESFPEGGSLLTTEYSGHAYTLARDAVLTGYDVIIAIGGDGTISQVVGGYISAKGMEAGASIGIIPSGTGGDFVRTFEEFSKDPVRALELVVLGEKVIIDAGMARVTHDSQKEGRDSPSERYFVNVASLGISHSGAVVKSIEETSYAKVTGSWTYWIHSIVGNLAYKPKPVDMELWDGDVSRKIQMNLYEAAIGNCRYFGGAMKIAPYANPCDGKFDATIVSEMSLLELIRHLEPGLRAGDFDKRLPEHITLMKTTKFVARPVNPLDRVYVEIDGEIAGEFRELEG
ncbi:hypothetical protein HDU67_009661 [Dinochytrium kinnereticum]|nr:hypothetical protein HDU67_009661 [Dinochytrium kinnereticum]